MLVKIKVQKKRFLLLFLLAFCLVTTFIVLVTCLAVLIPRNKEASGSSSSKSHDKPVSTGSIGTAPPSPSDGISTSPSVTVDPQSTAEDGGENFLENSNEVPTQEETIEASTEPPTVVTDTNVQSFVCPASYAYISYEDARNFQDMICANNTYAGALRVEEGGSVSCANGFSLLESDPRVLDQAICVKTTYSNPQKVSHTNLECPMGLARASLEEAKIYIRQLCPKLGKWDILRVGVQGAFYGPGYGCKLYEWYTGSVTDVLCIKRQIIDMTFGPANENVCENNNSLYTVQEALSNSEELCAKIPEDGNVRLAGGSAMYGTGNDCKIIDVDRDSIGQALCGPISRN